MVGLAVGEATGTDTSKKRPKNDVSDRQVVVMGSGNLGLVYLMDERRRLTLEEIEARHPALIPALREHPHVGWLLVRSEKDGAVALGGGGVRYLADDRVEGDDPLANFSPTAAQHLRRTDGFADVADIMVGSFYDPQLDEGCAFEELISFHGGLGGLQTRPFILYPVLVPASGRADHRSRRRSRPPARLAPAAAGHRRATAARRAAAHPEDVVTRANCATASRLRERPRDVDGDRVGPRADTTRSRT